MMLPRNALADSQIAMRWWKRRELHRPQGLAVANQPRRRGVVREIKHVFDAELRREPVGQHVSILETEPECNGINHVGNDAVTSVCSVLTSIDLTKRLAGENQPQLVLARFLNGLGNLLGRIGDATAIDWRV